MKVSLNWLNEFVDLSEIGVDRIVDALTAAGLEVDGHQSLGIDGIVVGLIASIEEHESADRLVICHVDVGDGASRQIVCGATNMEEGDRVAVALPGADLPALGFSIEVRKVAGEKSEGMLCARDELGLEDESEGIWILDASLELGRPVFEATGLQDTIISLDLTPNRPDCLSHRGVARELAALFDAPLRSPELSVELSENDRLVQVEVTGEACPHYLLAAIEGVEVSDSPDWLQARLAAIGVRSINGVVDVTNYVLQHLGHPMHAFDAEKVKGGVIVRSAAEGETIEGIDHREYTLTSEDLVIADEAGPIAIAGVMGGVRTEVSEETKSVLLECAYFDPMSVRRTSKRLGLHTDSSHRFERGVDPNGLIEALKLAVHLLCEMTAGATALGYRQHYPVAVERARVDLSTELVRRLLGLSMAVSDVAALLEALGIDVEESEERPDTVVASVPTFRPDLTRPVDLVEEVARLHGYDSIEASAAKISIDRGHTPRTKPRHEPTVVSESIRTARTTMHSVLRSAGLFEAVNYSFMSEDDGERLRLSESDPRRSGIRVSNPLTQAQGMMRTSMVPGLLKTLQTNVAQKETDFGVFEFGRVYLPEGEREVLGVLATGAQVKHFEGRDSWGFFDFKGLVEGLCHPFDVALEWSQPEPGQPYLHPGVQAVGSYASQVIATVGQVHPLLVRDLDLDFPVLLLELELNRLFSSGFREKRFAAIPRFPAVVRDFAFLISRDLPYSRVEESIQGLAKKSNEFGGLLESVELFDQYEGEQVPDGMRSLAFKFIFRSSERTLTDDEVSKLDQQLIDWLDEEINAQLR